MGGGQTDETRTYAFKANHKMAKKEKKCFRTHGMSHGRANKSNTYDGVDATNDRRTEAHRQQKFLVTSQQNFSTARPYLSVHVARYDLKTDN